MGLETKTLVPISSKISWPHNIKIGSNCTLEKDIFFKIDGPYNEGIKINIGKDCFIGKSCEFNITKSIIIKNSCLIASGCKFIDHDHGFADLTKYINLQRGSISEIVIDDNVWLGFNVIILKGVKIGYGAIVAAGSVVNKNIPANEIWGGIPAKKISNRFK
jgi:acetyltransferase-like isoleucine patch superfamily enzyme